MLSNIKIIPPNLNEKFRYVDFIAVFKDDQFYNSCDYFLWGYAKGLMYFPPHPASSMELKQRTTTALQTATQEMLQRVWEELEPQNDVCRVSGGVHIVHL